MASYVFYGALEEILTGWVLGQLEDGDEAIARAEQTVVEVICGGLAADRESRQGLTRDAGDRRSCAASGPSGGASSGRSGSARFGLAFSITTTAAYLPPLLHRFTESGALIGLVLGAEGVFALAALAGDRAVERHVPHAAGAPPSVHARRARPDGLLPRC